MSITELVSNASDKKHHLELGCVGFSDEISFRETVTGLYGHLVHWRDLYAFLTAPNHLSRQTLARFHSVTNVLYINYL